MTSRRRTVSLRLSLLQDCFSIFVLLSLPPERNASKHAADASDATAKTQGLKHYSILALRDCVRCLTSDVN